MQSETKHILAIHSLTNENIHNIISRAEHYRLYPQTDILKGKIIGHVFFEPSTRTNCSFQCATQRCGGTTIDLQIQFSSTKKGESLEDTIQTMEQYCDALIIRHPTIGSMKICADCTKIPVINAGDGTGEHPTQALLDLFTIQQYHRLTLPLQIAICGDLKNSRTCHSLIRLLDRLHDHFEFYLISKENFGLDDDFVRSLRNKCVYCSDLSTVIHNVDIIYMTRIQKERIQEECTIDNNICITNDMLNMAKSTTILMHPFPRNDELPKECDANLRSKYFEQMKNGVYVRMAILEHCFHG